MAGSSFRSSLLIAALLAAAAAAGYDIYLRQAAPTVVHDPPTAADLAKATEPLRKELEAARFALAALSADRDNLKQQLDALNKPAPAPAGDKAKDKANAAAAMQKQLDAATRQRDAALSEAAALKRRTQQLEAQPRPAPAPSPLQPAPAAGGKVYTQRSVAELRELYAGGEAAPGTPPAADETGKWIETTNMRVVGIAGGGVLLLKKDNSNIQCAFAEAAKAKLATLRVGDAVRVSGKINPDQNGQLVNLEDCEFKE
ncbi:MAG: hypothetical protein WAK63_07455 [Xanthobacteraceae bacterium]